MERQYLFYSMERVGVNGMPDLLFMHWLWQALAAGLKRTPPEPQPTGTKVGSETRASCHDA